MGKLGDEGDVSADHGSSSRDLHLSFSVSVRHERPEGNGAQAGGGGSPMSIKVPIIGFETMEDRARFTIFKLRVENDKMDESWLVFRRYTDFVRLHAKLKEEVPNLEICLPPKRWIRDNFETAFLEERMKGLQALIDSILVHPVLVSLPTVRKFFCLDEPPVYSETSDETESWCGILEDSSVMLKHRLREKEREIELLRAELALATAQKDNILKAVRNCRNCCQKPVVFASLTSPSVNGGNGQNPMSSSGYSSEHGSPRHLTSLLAQANVLLLKNRRSSTSSRTNSIHSDGPCFSKHIDKRLSNGSMGNNRYAEPESSSEAGTSQGQRPERSDNNDQRRNGSHSHGGEL